jgi:hypothetical protein
LGGVIHYRTRFGGNRDATVVIGVAMGFDERFYPSWSSLSIGGFRTSPRDTAIKVAVPSCMQQVTPAGGGSMSGKNDVAVKLVALLTTWQ